MNLRIIVLCALLTGVALACSRPRAPIPIPAPTETRWLYGVTRRDWVTIQPVTEPWSPNTFRLGGDGKTWRDDIEVAPDPMDDNHYKPVPNAPRFHY